MSEGYWFEEPPTPEPIEQVIECSMVGGIRTQESRWRAIQDPQPCGHVCPEHPAREPKEGSNG